MPNPKPHLIYTKAPEGTVEFRYKVRAHSPDAQVLGAPDIARYVSSVADIQAQTERRQAERSAELNITKTISCLDIEFFGWFNSIDFEPIYRTEFGLTPIRFYDLNRKGLFAVVDQALFQNFLGEIRKCIEATDHANPDYNTLVRYIKSIRYHSTERILEQLRSLDDTVYLRLIDNVELHGDVIELLSLLKEYLSNRQIEYNLNEAAHEIEIKNIDEATVQEIARNFDLVHSVNSASLMVTRPSRFGTGIREYPFTISEPEGNLPTIGIIDTGVSAETPLSALLINTDSSFSSSGSDPRVDEAFGGDGHGTAVAAFTALGKQLSGDIQRELTPDCKILSIKILDGSSGKVSNSEVAELIRRANQEHNIKVFVLTTCYNRCLTKGDAQSDYAFILDRLSFELDILIFICTANYSDWGNDIYKQYPRHYVQDDTNLCSPSESINNITVGAIGDNLEPEMPITPTKYPISSAEHPAVYTRKFHLDYDNLTLKNSKLCKPDVVYSGGNLACIVDRFGAFVEQCSECALQYLSANKLEPILRGVGTSFSTALVANLAAKLLKLYPRLKPQTIKALIINSAEKITLNGQFGMLQSHHKSFLTGQGKPAMQACLYSNDDEATIVIEDSIQIGQVKALPIMLPRYLNNVQKDKTLIGIEATLCYKVIPIQNNQLAYCPINIAFGLFKNVALEENTIVNNRTVRKGISGGGKEDICFNSIAWSQDGYYKSKMLSNSQKVSFYIKKSDIIRENNTFKLAINCHFHKLLPSYISQNLPQEYEFSLVIRLWENRRDKEGKLYSEISNINQLELLPNSLVAEQDIDLDADLDQ